MPVPIYHRINGVDKITWFFSKENAATFAKKVGGSFTAPRKKREKKEKTL